MKVSLNWLKDFVEIPFSHEELATRLSLAGLEVEEIILRGIAEEKVVVGKVLRSERHPDADRLKVCLVDVGNEQLQIVCGAPNVAEGEKVPVALVGAELPNGLMIKKAKIRGVESNGMICAEDELGLSDNHSGIMVLPQDAPVGMKLKDYLASLSDIVFDLSITPNRPDCLSHLGVAREIAAQTDTELTMPYIEVKEEGPDIHQLTRVTIHNPEGCPRYAARVIRNVSIGPSPAWLKNRLEAVGIRSINNVVDVTNYVLMELGHPLHAFDFDRLKGNEIRVRLSASGENFTTLDGKTHTLPENVVLICDAEQPVAIGGIMGGENSEVTFTTTNILLESAYFHPVFIHRAAKSLNISTEASQRFERGADPEGVIRALNRATQLILETAGGEVAKGIIDVYPNPIRPTRIPVRLDYLSKVIGIPLTLEQVEELLEPLGIVREGEVWIVPTYRPDLERPVDIAEEVARLMGFDNIPSRTVTEIPYGMEENRLDLFVDEVKCYFANSGFYEVITNSMVRKDFFEKLTGLEHIAILNPVSQDYTGLRRSLVLSMLEVIRTNVSRQNYDLRLFEINRTFHPRNDEEKLPEEQLHLCIAITGNRFPGHWSYPEQKVDFFDLKGIVELFLEQFSLDTYRFISYDNFVSNTENIAVSVNNEIVGFIAKAKNELLDAFDIEQDVYIADLNLAKIFEWRRTEHKFQEYSRFPRMERDMAFVMDRGIQVGDVLDFIKEEGGKHLVDVTVFDRYEGKGIPAGMQSLAFRLYYQSMERTLTDEEVNRAFMDIIQKIEKRFHARLRE